MSISLIHSGTVLDVVQECLSGQDCDACAYGHEFTELFVVRIDAESQIYLLQVRQEVWKCWGIQESYENSRPERTRIYIAFPLPKTSSQKVTNWTETDQSSRNQSSWNSLRFRDDFHPLHEPPKEAREASHLLPRDSPEASPFLIWTRFVHRKISLRTASIRNL